MLESSTARRNRMSKRTNSNSPANNKKPTDSRPFSLSRPLPNSALVPDPEDFAAWCEHPTTRYVAAAYERAALAQREDWLKKSWSSADLDPIERATLMARADAYSAFLETGLEGYVAIMEMQS